MPRLLPLGPRAPARPPSLLLQFIPTVEVAWTLELMTPDGSLNGDRPGLGAPGGKATIERGKEGMFFLLCFAKLIVSSRENRPLYNVSSFSIFSLDQEGQRNIFCVDIEVFQVKGASLFDHWVFLLRDLSFLFGQIRVLSFWLFCHPELSRPGSRPG